MSQEIEHKPKIEVIGEWFFPAPVYVFSDQWQEMVICPAPPEAEAKYGEVIGQWLNTYPKGSEIPGVSISPVSGLDKEGYLVQAHVMVM